SPQSPDYAQQGGQHTAYGPKDQRKRREVKSQLCRSYCSDPPGSQSVNNQRAITERANDSQNASCDCQNKPFFQKQRAHSPCRKSNSPESSDLAQSLFDTKLEEQTRKKQRADDQEKTEIDKIFAEVRGAF